jgi:hypothetical protein
MNRNTSSACAALCALVALGIWTVPASAQMAEVKDQ